MGGFTASVTRLLALPEGKRAIQPYSFAYTYWNFNSDKGLTGVSGSSVMYTDAGIAGSCANIYGTPWANQGLSLGLCAWNKVLTQIGNSGGKIDYMFADVEAGGMFSNWSLEGITGITGAFLRNFNYAQTWNGVTSLASQMSIEGATISKVFPRTGFDYLIWNKSVTTIVNALLNKVLWDPTLLLHTNIIGSNYDFKDTGSTYDSPPDLNGHPNYVKSIFGNAASPVLYGVIGQLATAWRIDPTDTTRILLGATSNPLYTVSRSAWNSFLLDIQTIRSAKRNSSNTPLTPWIASPKYAGVDQAGVSPAGAPPVGYADVTSGYNADIGYTFGSAGNSAYYYEMVRHASLHGVKSFGYYNAEGSPSGITQRAGLLNTVLTEINNNIGSYRLDTATSARVDWLAKQLTSGTAKSWNNYIWRTTVEPGNIAEYVSTPNIVLNGTTVGAWITTSNSTPPEIKPFSLNELFYVQTAYSGEYGAFANGSAVTKFLGNNNPTIAAFQGTAYVDNAATTLSSSGRAYNFELNPANPTQSSPWHNTLYELAIDSYKWGARSFMLYWPQGGLGFYNYPFRYLELLDDGYYSSTTDPAYCPARIKGFTSAVKGLLEGKLDPALNGKVGFTAINEPCNVMLYYVCTNGFSDYRWGKVAPHPTGSTYYPGSMAFWDKCYTQTGNSAAADALFYSYLDRFVNDIVSMKGGPTAGTLSVVFDSMVNSATPGTIGQFSSLSSPYTRGISYEMADWYVDSKLKENKIPTYVEARPLKEYSTLTASLTSGNASLIPGICGATAISDWRNHLSVEYNIYFQNPDFNKTDPFIQRFVKDSETTTAFRWVQNTGPLASNIDPYKVPLTVSTGGTSVTLTYDDNAGWLYTPHQSLFNLYAMSDVYRQFNNSANTGLTFFGAVYKPATRGIILDYEAFARGSSGNLTLNPCNNYSSLTGYYRLSSDNSFEGNRVGYGRENSFNRTSFVANGASYNARYNASPTGTAGYWTLNGIDFWRANVKQPSITGFIEMLRQVSIAGIPVGGFSAGWVGATYPYDTYSTGIMPRSMRP